MIQTMSPTIKAPAGVLLKANKKKKAKRVS